MAAVALPCCLFCRCFCCCCYSVCLRSGATPANLLLPGAGLALLCIGIATAASVPVMIMSYFQLLLRDASTIAAGALTAVTVMLMLSLLIFHPAALAAVPYALRSSGNPTKLLLPCAKAACASLLLLQLCQLGHTWVCLVFSA